MKRYIRATDDEILEVWDIIPEKYYPYISEVQVNNPYSQYQNKKVTTYSAYFTDDVINYYREKSNSYLVGLIHCEDLESLLSGIGEYLDPLIGEGDYDE